MAAPGSARPSDRQLPSRRLAYLAAEPFAVDLDGEAASAPDTHARDATSSISVVANGFTGRRVPRRIGNAQRVGVDRLEFGDALQWIVRLGRDCFQRVAELDDVGHAPLVHEPASKAVQWHRGRLVAGAVQREVEDLDHGFRQWTGEAV